MFKAMHEVLKPGGILGLVAHRGTPEMVGIEWAERGYVSEAEAVRLAETAGFQLVERSEIHSILDRLEEVGCVAILESEVRHTRL